MSKSTVAEIIVISFWSGRTEKYYCQNGTVQDILDKSGVTLRFGQDCIYRDQLPADWYMGFYRDHMDDKLMPWDEVNTSYSPKYLHFYIVDRTN